MLLRITRILRHILRALLYSTIGATVVLVTVFVLYLDSREDLSIWHQASLDEEFTAASKVTTFADYLALEDRLFRQLDQQVYTQVKPEEGDTINRYRRGSLADPERWSPNWNRSYELKKDKPRAVVLLLHGMSDSPYSLRHLGERLHATGAHVLGLRIPGHGTAPSGLMDVSWQDMAAAVKLAVRHLAAIAGSQPLYIVGYSNGAALAVNYTLAMLDDGALPKVKRLVILSPEIGVTPVAGLSFLQARLGHILGLQKLAWNVILPEYDPFKYGSFAVNAGNVAYELTNHIQQRISTLDEAGKLTDLPKILAFSSAADATVSTPALVQNLFARLPVSGHELVLFDVNRLADIQPIMKWKPAAIIQALPLDANRTFTVSLVTNKNQNSQEVMLRSKRPGEAASVDSDLVGLAWPEDIYSLSHIALPFPPQDSLYGKHKKDNSDELHLGDIALRGERDVLKISQSDILRLRWNPFYPYIESRVAEFFELEK